jgi:hypothetical protein
MLHSGRPVDNVIGIKSAGVTTVDAIGNAVKTAWEATGGPLKAHSTNTAMTGYKVVDIGSTTGAVTTIASAAVGAASGTIAVLSSCALITYGTGTRSRSARGRMYHGPLTTGQVNADGRSLAAGVQSTLLTAYTQFDAAITSAGFEWVVLSRKYGHDQAISTFGVSPLVATQRRRMRS